MEMENICNNKQMKLDASDEYIYLDFRNTLDENVFDSYEEARDFVAKNMPRVMVEITQGEGFFLKKDEVNMIDTIVSSIPSTVNVSFTMITRGKKGRMQEKEENISLKDFISARTIKLAKYSSLAFKPRDHNLYKYQYNCWSEFVGHNELKTDEPTERLSNILDFVKDIICDGEDISYRYIISWLHQIITRPWDKTRICIFCQSEPGAGKGTFTNFLINYVFGQHVSKTVCGIQPLVQKHNKVLMNKIFISVDEIPSYNQGSFHGTFDKMKHLITEPTVSIEPKNKEVIDIENNANFFMTTNNKYSIKVEKGDRRYFCLRVSSKKKGNPKYWRNLYDNVLTEEGGKEFYSYLYNLTPDDNEIIPLYPIPMNKFKEELVIASESPVDTFLKDIREEVMNIQLDNTGSAFVFSDDGENIYIQTTTLYNKFKEWCLASGEKVMKQKIFSSMIKERLEYKSVLINGKTLRVFDLTGIIR